MQNIIQRKVIIIIVAVYIAIVFVIIGRPYYNTYLSPWYTPVLEVKDRVFNMRYFIKRFRLYMGGAEKGSQAISIRLLEEIQNNELIRMEAEKRGISVSDEEINSEVKTRVKESATGEGEFDQLYESMLRGLRLDKDEFEDLVRSDILQGKLFRSFMNQLPAEAGQVHVHAILTGTAERADSLRARLAAGERFSSIAQKESIDLQSAKEGGDLGWFPENVWKLSATGLVHVKGILTKTEDESELIREKILAGQSFSALARKYSLDEGSMMKGGYLGWVSTDYKTGKQFAAAVYELSPGILSEPIDTYEGFWIIRLIEKAPAGNIFDDYVFKQPIGRVTPPLFTKEGYYLFRVTERDEKRPINEEQRKTLAMKLMNEWLHDTAEKGAEEGWIKWYWGSDSLNWALRNLN